MKRSSGNAKCSVSVYPIMCCGTASKQRSYTCNPRHHSLAFTNPVGPFKAGDLNHVMLDAKSLDNFGRGYDTARATEVPIPMIKQHRFTWRTRLAGGSNTGMVGA